MSKKILIVDDDESIRLGFKEILERAGYKIYLASQAQEACEIIEKQRPDGIILDYYLLNDLSGIDICRFVKGKKKFKNIKMMMITGVLSKNQAQKMMHFGFDKILIKPIESDHLLSEARQLLINE